jgi:hypothetical protein
MHAALDEEIRRITRYWRANHVPKAGGKEEKAYEELILYGVIFALLLVISVSKGWGEREDLQKHATAE